ncbi:MAG: shikimate dehydrogenase [Gemmatimonadaceae bacterium]
MTVPRRLVLIGHPVAHSLSPRMQSAALAAAGVTATYSALDVAPAQLVASIDRLRTEGAAGNVTIPHKEPVFAMCGRVSEIARLAGAVNTFWFEDGVLVGTNTDVGGFNHVVRQLMSQHHRPMPVRVAIIGAGGSARAVATAVSRWDGAKATIWSRTAERARELARGYDCARAEPDLASAVQGAHLVVNATPIGLHDDLFPAPVDMLASDSAVVDLVYRSGATSWVRAVRAHGIVATDGLPMLVEQGALAFECWFGVEPNRRVMWEAVTG